MLGSAIPGGKWQPAGKRFVDSNVTVLRHQPRWLFSVSTRGEEDSMFSRSCAGGCAAVE